MPTHHQKGLACCGALPDPGTGTKPVSNATLAITSQNTDTVKGYATINGTSIVKGELQIKFPHYNRGNPFKVALNPAKPYLLEQGGKEGWEAWKEGMDGGGNVRKGDMEEQEGEEFNARNCLITAFDIYESKLTSSQDKDTIIQHLTQITTTTHQARTSLSHRPPTQTFPTKEPDPKLFTPDLPDDLVVEFHVNRSSLVVGIYAVNFHHAGFPLEIQKGILSKFKNFKLDTYKGRPVEILDEFTTESTCPTFTALFQAIEFIEERCALLKKKLQVEL
ncbi:hypothetical protein HDV00_004720 [Rhizophlyctis rosea]|nr:hypothetical protein HDV00_004720 [Rhizophlyctis rosea]